MLPHEAKCLHTKRILARVFGSPLKTSNAHQGHSNDVIDLMVGYPCWSSQAWTALIMALLWLNRNVSMLKETHKLQYFSEPSYSQFFKGWADISIKICWETHLKIFLQTAGESSCATFWRTLGNILGLKALHCPKMVTAIAILKSNSASERKLQSLLLPYIFRGNSSWISWEIQNNFLELLPALHWFFFHH